MSAAHLAEIEKHIRAKSVEPQRFTRERLADIEPQLESALVKGVLPRRGVAFVAGPSTSAKTFLGLEVGFRVSRGEPVCGRRTREAGVIYIAAEDAGGVRQRVKAWKLRNGDRGEFQLIGKAPNLRDPELLAALEAAITEAAVEMDAENVPLGLVVIDTVSKAAPGADQNASGDMGEVMATLEALSGRLNALLLVIAHTPKDESRGIAGWYGQFAGADAVVMCTRDTEDDALRVATVVKLKNGQDGQRLAFRLEEVEIGQDEDGDTVTSCVVAFEEAPARAEPRKKVVKLGAPETIALKSVSFVIDHGETEQAPSLPGVRYGTLAVQAADVRTQAFASGFSDESTTRNTRNVRWNRAIEKLVAAERIRTSGDLIWLA